MIIPLLIAIFGAFGICLPAHVSARTGSTALLRVGILKNYLPVFSVNHSTRLPEGFAVDLMNKIASSAKLRIEYVAFDSLADLLCAIEEESIDLIPDLARTSGREEQVMFSNNLDVHPVVIFVRSSRDLHEQPLDIVHEHIAVINDYTGPELLRRFGSRGVQEYGSASEALWELIAGRADMIVASSPIVLGEAKLLGLAERITPIAEPLLEIKRAIAVRKGLADLIPILNREIDRLHHSPVYERAYSRWYDISEPWLSNEELVVACGSILALGLIIILFLRYRLQVTLNRKLVASVAETVEVQKELRRSEEKFRAVFEGSGIGIAISVRNGTVIGANPAFLNSLDYTLSELQTRNIEEILGAAHGQSGAIPSRAESGTPGRNLHLRRRLHRKDGSAVWARVTQTSVVGRDETDSYIISMVEDITDQQQLDDELARAEKLESLGMMAGGIAHDFNNLLTAILGNVSLAMVDLPAGSELSELMAEVERATARAQKITHQLLTFSKGGVPVTKTMPIQELIQEAALLAISGTRCQCVFDLPVDLEFVKIDEGQINQVFNNLVLNSTQAMKDGGRITISARSVALDEGNEIKLRPGRYLEIKVSDEGTGIDEETQKKIFDPFFTTKPQGSGLGLSTSYSIIARHGGDIRLESQVNRGTIFTIYLPVARAMAAIEAGGNPTNQGRILILDDDKAVLKFMKTALRKLRYDVETATTTKDALVQYERSLTNQTRFDAAILDLSISGGQEALTRLRQIDPRAVAIVSSGFANDPIMRDYSAHGFNNCIAKPFSIKQLHEVLQSTLQRASQTQASAP